MRKINSLSEKPTLRKPNFPMLFKEMFPLTFNTLFVQNIISYFVLKCVRAVEITTSDVHLCRDCKFNLCDHFFIWNLVSTRNTENHNHFRDCNDRCDFHRYFFFVNFLIDFKNSFFLTDLLPISQLSIAS